MVLILLTAVLLTLAAAPFGQFYLAWVGLAPLIVGVARAKSMRWALFWAWLGGVAYFVMNLWWLWTASTPGTVGLVMYFALYWALAAGLMRGLGLLQPLSGAGSAVRVIVCVLGIATVWVAAEWLRCYVMTGFPWMPLGTSQTPALVMCQVADFGGPWIVSFWVVLPNALLALYWLNRKETVWWQPAVAMVAAVIVLAFAYGVYRFVTEETTSGPRVMVIQSNFPVLPGGTPTVEIPQAVEFFLAELEKNLAAEQADLIILPEAEFPPLNDEARSELARAPIGPFLESTYQKLLAIAREHHTSLLVGGNAVTNWSMHGTEHVGSEIRNSAYFFDPGATPPVVRYDKIELVRFSERAPLTVGPAWLRRLAMGVSANRASQPLFAGSLSDLQPFQLRWLLEGGHGTRGSMRFITPICLENIDPATVARMIRSTDAPFKQADFIANLSNDGWFATQEKYAHLQSTLFRCIENRVPMVRSSNTGISAFIDSSGRVAETIAANQKGFAVRRIELDGRHTLYTRFGDWFAYVCLGVVAVAVVVRMGRVAGSKLRR